MTRPRRGIYRMSTVHAIVLAAAIVTVTGIVFVASLVILGVMSS